MAGRGIGVGYMAICVGIRIWRWAGARVRAHPVTAGTVYIDIDVVAPAVAVVLEDVPARNVCYEPSLVPTWRVYISSILSVERSIGIPFIKPDVARTRCLQP